MKQKEVVSVGNNEIQTAANLCFLMPGQPGRLYQGEIETQIHEKLKILKTPTLKMMQHRHFLLSESRPGQRFLTPLADTLHSTGLGFDPLQACTPFPSMTGTLD